MCASTTLPRLVSLVSWTWKGRQSTGSSPRINFYIWTSPRVEAHQRRCSPPHEHKCTLLKTMFSSMHSLPRSRMSSSLKVKLSLLPLQMVQGMPHLEETAGWWHGANSKGSGGQTTSKEKAHSWMQSYLWELLASSELPNSYRQHARRPLGISRWMVQDSPNSFFQHQAEGSTGELHGGSSRGHLTANKTLDKVSHENYQLHARNNAESRHQKCDTWRANRGPWTQGLIHKCNV